MCRRHSNSSKTRHYQTFEHLERDVSGILFHHKLATPVIGKAEISRCHILQTTRLLMNNFCLTSSCSASEALPHVSQQLIIASLLIPGPLQHKFNFMLGKAYGNTVDVSLRGHLRNCFTNPVAPLTS